jgi:hypothetical protein
LLAQNGIVPQNHSNPQDSNPQDSNKKVRILEYQNEKRTMKNFASPNGNIPENHSNPQDSNPQDSNKKVRRISE